MLLSLNKSKETHHKIQRQPNDNKTQIPNPESDNGHSWATDQDQQRCGRSCGSQGLLLDSQGSALLFWTPVLRICSLTYLIGFCKLIGHFVFKYYFWPIVLANLLSSWHKIVAG